MCNQFLYLFENLYVIENIFFLSILLYMHLLCHELNKYFQLHLQIELMQDFLINIGNSNSN